MNACPFEPDVLDALASRRWPARVDEALSAHVVSCASCADLAAVAGALLHEGETTYGEAHVPPAAAVWHRAQLRAREDAARAATRPIGFVQGVAFACGVAAAIAAAVWGLPILAAQLPGAGAAAAWLTALRLPAIDLDGGALLANTAVQIAAASWALLVPVALYFTLRDTNP